MIPELSLFCLILTGILALWTSVSPWIMPQATVDHRVRFARMGLYSQATLLLLAYLGLTWSFINSDFTVQYVAEHSSLALPWYYRLTAVWGAHEGSMLLWALLFSFWMVAFAWRSKHQCAEEVLMTSGILAAINAGFIGFILFTSNPFLRTLPTIPTEGADLNPLLQDPGFLIHPPMLYMGYVGFGLCFAMALTAVWRKELTIAWAVWLRPWILVSWCFLTVGIALGSWWAYRELGWGGWWFWDPVENAAFLPWLIGTALLHSILVVEKRGYFKAWTLLLTLIGFGLSLLGTFLVRSGVLTSVHAFAVDPKRGIYILAFICIVIGGSLSLFAYRVRDLKQDSHFHWLSRESLLLANTLLFLVLMITILVGTLYPLFIDAIGLGKLSVGAPYFNSVFAPLAIPLFILMGLGPHCLWRDLKTESLLKKLKPVLIATACSGLCLLVMLLLGMPFGVVLGLTMSVWIVLSTVRAFSWNKIAMVLAHIGVALSLIGVCITSYYSDESLVKVTPNEQATLGPYRFYLRRIENLQGANYHGVKAEIDVFHDGQLYDKLFPEKRLFEKNGMPMTHAAIHIGWWGDLYVALGEPIGKNAWSLRLYRKPFIRWIWAGGLLMMLGGAMAVLQTLQRKKTL